MTVDSGVAARAVTKVVAILLAAFAAVLAGIAVADGDLCYTRNMYTYTTQTEWVDVKMTILLIQITLYNTVRLGAVCLYNKMQYNFSHPCKVCVCARVCVRIPNIKPK